MMLFAMLQTMGNPIGFLIGFLVFICVVAIVIIGARWLLSLTGVTIPQPLMVILGIVLFLVLLLVFLNWIPGGQFWRH